MKATWKIVAARKNNQPWIVTLEKEDDFLNGLYDLFCERSPESIESYLGRDPVWDEEDEDFALNEDGEFIYDPPLTDAEKNDALISFARTVYEDLFIADADNADDVAWIKKKSDDLGFSGKLSEIID